MDTISRDALGPAKVIQVHEPGLGLDATLVVDNVALGPSIGGLRIAADVTVQECFRLARAMTLKNAAAGLAHGGGKSVMRADPRLPRERKERLVRAFAHALRNEADYIFGPDMGSDESCMAWVKDEVGRAVGLPVVLGGIPLDELGATGWGIAQCAEVAVDYCALKLCGSRVAVQGYGAVGRHAARFLAERGAVLVAASDSAGAIHAPAGLDLARLDALKRDGRSVGEHGRGERLERDAIIAVECDIFVPAARPDVLREDNVEQLRARLVLQGANIPFTESAEKRLQDKGVLVVPDFIANAGGVICAALEHRGATHAVAFAAIAEKIRMNTDAVLREAKDRRCPPREAALRLATRRINEAMSYRRFSIM